MSAAHAAVLLVGFGGPESSEEIRPFLDRVLAGRPVSRDRYEEVVRHYEGIGGRSPYNDLTRRHAAGLLDTLKASGQEIGVGVGFRNASPSIKQTVAELSEAGNKRIAVFILSAFRCEASWDRYVKEVDAACGAAGLQAIYPQSWHAHPLFIEAAAARVRDALAKLDDAERDSSELIFTAHSIPVAMAGQALYVEQFREAAELVARRVKHPRWHLAYQSRSGNPRDRWLEPDIREALVANHNPKIVMPLGFLCDHVEVLYDLDVEAAEAARRAGIRFERAATLGAHPRFIQMMSAIVRDLL